MIHIPPQEGVISTSKHNLVEQYHFKLYREIGHIPADTDVGLWLFEGEDETTLYEYNDSILEVRLIEHFVFDF